MTLALALALLANGFTGDLRQAAPEAIDVLTETIDVLTETIDIAVEAAQTVRCAIEIAVGSDQGSP